MHTSIDLFAVDVIAQQVAKYTNHIFFHQIGLRSSHFILTNSSCCRSDLTAFELYLCQAGSVAPYVRHGVRPLVGVGAVDACLDTAYGRCMWRTICDGAPLTPVVDPRLVVAMK